MIGLDTNVVLRLLTGDPPAQQAAARAVLEREASANDPAFVNRVVVIETAHVRSERRQETGSFPFALIACIQRSCAGVLARGCELSPTIPRQNYQCPAHGFASANPGVNGGHAAPF